MSGPLPGVSAKIQPGMDFFFAQHLTVPRATFSQNLARIRKQRGLSQSDLAERAGLSRRIINHYETQAVQPPIDKIEAIAEALGIKPLQLLDPSPKTTEKDAALDLTDIDPRSVKKLKDILSLPTEDRNILYRDCLVLNHCRSTGRDKNQ